MDLMLFFGGFKTLKMKNYVFINWYNVNSYCSLIKHYFFFFAYFNFN